MAIYNHIDHVVLKVILLCVLSSSVACTDEKVAPEQSHITFDISNSDEWNNVSRGAELTQATLNTIGFGVFAYYTEDKDWSAANITTPNFMNNTEVTNSSGSSWAYSPIKYWPHDQRDKVSFFAYAPYSDGQTATGSKLNFTVATDVDNQVDLVWSNSPTMNLNKNTSRVHFAFKHALARIGFTVNATAEGEPLSDGITIRIKKVAVRGLYTSGELDMSNTSPVADWSNESGSGKYSLEPENFVGKHADGFVLNSTNTSSTAHKLNLDDAYIMVIPQDFSSQGLNVYVEYEVELASKVNQENWDVYHQYTNQCEGTVKVELEPNKTYIINITTDLKNATVDDVSITPWETGGDVSIGGIVPDIVQ